MNANTRAEARSFAVLEIADPAKNLILVPLAQLRSRRSRRNVRRAPRQSIPELAASIERIGLLQSLTRLKKGEIAREAERLTEGTGWMPALFWPESGYASALRADQEATEDMSAVDGKRAALAA